MGLSPESGVELRPRRCLSLGESGQSWEGWLQRLAPGPGAGPWLLCVYPRGLTPKDQPLKQGSSDFQMHSLCARYLQESSVAETLVISLSHKCRNWGLKWGFKNLPRAGPGDRPGLEFRPPCSGFGRDICIGSLALAQGAVTQGQGGHLGGSYFAPLPQVSVSARARKYIPDPYFPLSGPQGPPVAPPLPPGLARN